MTHASTLVYFPQTAATAPATECCTIRDGQISERVLIFDWLSLAPPVDAGSAGLR